MTSYIFSLSLLIAAVLLLRALLRQHIPARLTYALWLAVLVRLCLPGTLFTVELPPIDFLSRPPVTAESVVTTSPKTAFSEGIGTAQEADSKNEPPISAVPGVNTAEPIAPGIPPDAVQIDPSPRDTVQNTPSIPLPLPTVTDTPAPRSEKPLDPMRIIRTIWFGGSLVLALWLGGSWLLFISRLHRDRIPHGRIGRVRVWISPSVGTPCLCGPIPAIYLTPETARGSSLPLVLLHEKTHLLHGDPLWAAVRTLLVILFWWNPLVWAAAIISRRDAEFACDEAVAAQLNDKQRLQYARMIVDTLPHRRPALTFGAEPIKARIRMLTAVHKYRLGAALLALLLTLSAVGCSLIDIGTREDSGTPPASEDTTAPPVTEIPEDIRIVENPGELVFRHLVLPAEDNRWTVFEVSQTRRLILLPPREGEELHRLYLFDAAVGGCIAAARIPCSKLLSQAAYTADGCILYDADYDPALDAEAIHEAFFVSCADGKLSVSEAADFTATFPRNDKYVYSPDGFLRAYAVRTDLDGSGYLEVFTDLYGRRRVEKNVTYRDTLQSGADLSAVRSYSPVAFLDNTHLLYQIHAYEGTAGYGIYDMMTDSRTPVEEVVHRQFASLFAVSDENWYIEYPTVDGEVREIWRYSLDGSAVRIAGYAEQTRDGVLKLPPEEYSLTFCTDESLVIADLLSLADMTDEERRASAETLPLRVYGLADMEEDALLEVRASFLLGSLTLFAEENILTFVTFDPDAPEPSLLAAPQTTVSLPEFDPAPRWMETEPYLQITRNPGNFDISVIGLPTEWPNAMTFDYDAHGRYAMILTAIPARRSEKDQQVTAWRDQHLYIFDRAGGMITAHTAIPGNIRPDQVTYTDDGPILYALQWTENLYDATVTAAYRVRYTGDDDVILEESDLVGIPAFSREPGERSLYPIHQNSLVSRDGTYRVYTTVDDPEYHGGLDLVRPDGSVERIFRTVQLGDRLPDGGEADLGKVIGYYPVAFLDDTRLVYGMSGWEWSNGFGIYDVKTGENRVLSNGEFGVIGCHDGIIYAEEDSRYGYATAGIWAFTPEGEKTQLVAIPEEQQRAESHSAYFLRGDAWLVIDYLDDTIRCTVTSLDLKTERAVFTLSETLYNRTLVNLYLHGRQITVVTTVSP